MPKRSASHVRSNRADWDAIADRYQDEHQPQLSARPMCWGVWGIPEDELNVLGDVAGKDVLELGCGAAQWSLGLESRGARPVGVDLSYKQLGWAQEIARSTGSEIPLTLADAERLPFTDGSFDVVFCDHGAMSFADPYRTVPEAARVMRPGGLFAFMITTPFMHVCLPEGAEHPEDRLVGDYFGMHAIRYVEDGRESFDFQIPYGEWIRLFLESGLAILDLIEVRPDEHATSTYRTESDRKWALRWPMENIWKLRKN
jgi:SAM-dependent methyltransferase